MDNKSDILWKNTKIPWEFPKGRKNYNEHSLCCALRELHEETNINLNWINIDQTPPIVYNYKGLDDNYYRTIYYTARLIRPIRNQKKI